MNLHQNQEEIQFLITQQKQRKEVETSQDKLSFNLSVTIKNQSIKNTPVQCKVSAFGDVSPYGEDNVDPNDFFDNFDKYYKIEGLTPIRSYEQEKESPLKLAEFNINYKKQSRQYQQQFNQISSKQQQLSEKQNNPFFKKNNKSPLNQDKERDNKNRLRQILKDKPLKSIMNMQAATEIIKINNISPLLLGGKTKITERKNTPLGMLGKKSKTICNTRKSYSLLNSKRLVNSQYPSIFCDNKKLNDFFKHNENWKIKDENSAKEKNNCLLLGNKQFQIHKKTNMLKRRPSNSIWEDIGVISPKFATIRI